MNDLETEVLVVGAGPVGVMLGLLLADQGVSAVVIDKRSEVSQLPRARGLNARGTEILRMVGVEDDMVAHALHVEPQLQIRQDLAHPPVVVQATGGDSFTTVSPCEGIAISQDVLESVLRDHLGRRESVGLRVGWRLVGLKAGTAESDSTAVAVDPDGRSHEIRARFVVGADGWRSDVRSLLGIAVTGPGDLGRMRSVRFRADLSPWLGDPPPAFLRLTGLDGVLLGTHPDHRWVLIAPDHAASDPIAAGLVARSLGVDSPVDVLEDTAWTAAVQQAVRFQEGNVFLVGDAAHRVTPAGATGITSGMADAANLAWKLSGALRGWAGPHLLASYRQEREPVASWIGAANVRMWTDSQQGHQTPIELRWLEFGYRYHSTVIEHTPGSLADVDLASVFVPTAEPGDRAPHARLQDGRSTIYLPGSGFTLLAAGNSAGWLEAARAVETPPGTPLAAVSDPGEDLQTTHQLSSGQAILIRPDGHIAWRSDSHQDHRPPTQRLHEAVRMATGWWHQNDLSARPCVGRLTC